MKALLSAIILLLLTNLCLAQHVYQIRADSVRIYNICDTAELIIENHTQGTLGFLYNKGKGRTEFKPLQLEKVGSSQLAITGQDTLDISTLTGLGVDTIFRSGDNIYYTKRDIQYTIYAPLPAYVEIPQGSAYGIDNFETNRVVGFGAYVSPDMPALSDQALNNTGSGSNYYVGHMVRNGSFGYQMAVNWDGELAGPQGAFIRSKDDTKTAWSNWRELVFKDYLESHYIKSNDLDPRARAFAGTVIPGALNTSNGVFWDYGDLNDIKFSFLGSVAGLTNVPTTDPWHFVMQSSHRNGAGDGNQWNWQIVSPLTSGSHEIYARWQHSGTWSGYQRFWTNYNFDPDNKLSTGGGTMTGDININNHIGLSWAANTDGAFIKFESADNGGGTRANSNLVFGTLDDGNEGFLFKHNSSEVMYVNLNEFSYKGNTVWHNGNLIPSVTSIANTVAQRDASANILANGFYQGSLAVLKKNIQDFNENALQLLDQVQIKQFIYKSDKDENVRVGIIADSTDWHFSTRKHDRFDTNSSLAITMKAVQELNKENELLKQQNLQLQEQLQIVLHRLERLENKLSKENN